MANAANTIRNAVTTNPTAAAWSTSGTTTRSVTLLRWSHDSRGTPARAGLAAARSGSTGFRPRTPGSCFCRGLVQGVPIHPERRGPEDRRHKQQECQQQRELTYVGRVGDLPDLGTKEQKDHQDHEHGQGPRDEPDEMRQLEPQALERPHADLDETKPDHDVDHADTGKRTERCRDELSGVLVDERRRQRWQDPMVAMSKASNVDGRSAIGRCRRRLTTAQTMAIQAIVAAIPMAFHATGQSGRVPQSPGSCQR